MLYKAGFEIRSGETKPMTFRSRFYLWLNRLCGAPIPGDAPLVREYHDAKTGDIGPIHTLPAFPPDAAVLVIGCDEFAAELHALWQRVKPRLLVGVDINDRVVQAARQRVVDLQPMVQVHLVGDAALPFADATFDVIYMHNVCEHLIQPGSAFAEYHRVLRQGGLLFNTFSPLFYSAYGAHQAYALRLPWGHLVFGLSSVVEIRNLYYSGSNHSRTWAEFGLNRLTLGSYAALIQRAGFRSARRRVHVSGNLSIVGRLPVVRNLFIQGVEDYLVRV